MIRVCDNYFITRLPLTGKGCIKRVLTDLALLDIEGGRFILRERAPGVTVEEIVNLTAGELVVPEQVPYHVPNYMSDWV